MASMNIRKPYPTDVTEEEWEFVAPYLTLFPLNAAQRQYDLREVFNALRWLIKSGAPWRLLPHDFPPWAAVYQQAQRWIRAQCFEAMAHDLRMLLRLGQEREPEPTATILDSRTLQSTPESGARAGYDGAMTMRLGTTSPMRIRPGWVSSRTIRGFRASTLIRKLIFITTIIGIAMIRRRGGIVRAIPLVY
jgi:transposase